MRHLRFIPLLTLAILTSCSNDEPNGPIDSISASVTPYLSQDSIHYFVSNIDESYFYLYKCTRTGDLFYFTPTDKRIIWSAKFEEPSSILADAGYGETKTIQPNYSFFAGDTPSFGMLISRYDYIEPNKYWHMRLFSQTDGSIIKSETLTTSQQVNYGHLYYWGDGRSLLITDANINYILDDSGNITTSFEKRLKDVLYLKKFVPVDESHFIAYGNNDSNGMFIYASVDDIRYYSQNISTWLSRKYDLTHDPNVDILDVTFERVQENGIEPDNVVTLKCHVIYYDGVNETKTIKFSDHHNSLTD